jgi:hypothetical protein
MLASIDGINFNLSYPLISSSSWVFPHLLSFTSFLLKIWILDLHNPYVIFNRNDLPFLTNIFFGAIWDGALQTIHLRPEQTKFWIILMHVPCIFFVFITTNKCTITYHNSISLYNIYCYMFRHFCHHQGVLHLCTKVKFPDDIIKMSKHVAVYVI